jgi:hypothetical protein
MKFHSMLSHIVEGDKLFGRTADGEEGLPGNFSEYNDLKQANKLRVF